MLAISKKQPKPSSFSKNMIGMSPIISFRALNKVGLHGQPVGAKFGSNNDSGHD
jgi:hypothetical protein